MKIKKFVLFQFVLMATLAFSCDEDETKLQFKNQDLQGKMFGVSWEYADGNAITQEGQLSAALYASFDADLCYGTSNNTSEPVINFFAPNAVGVYNLETNPNVPAPHVWMIDVDPEPGGPGGPVVLYGVKGKIEIITITETELTGRIVASQGKNIVNGNFTIPFCSEPD